ncbi:MAG: DUF1295 domain-containing protein [Clostridia bacterium]|nr:DUF1295 domain-containing protein [Clostridia bacterium]
METLKHNRKASFIVILLIYILAAAVGIVVYRNLDLPWWLAVLFADVAATVFTFACSVIFDNASVYDPYWSVQPPVILLSFALGRSLTAFGVFLLIAVSLWAVRLTANWAYTFGDLSHQDWRYTMLKEKTGAFYPAVNFVGIHMVPTLVVYGCTLPAVFAIREGLMLNALSAIFLCISLFAMTMQGIADVQMHKFRKHRDSTFIHMGLWKYARHPNYLGEILMWWGVALSVVCATSGVFYLIAGALANTALFLFVSIPLAEGRQSKKEGYEAYKAQTRALLPLKKTLK